MEMPVKAEALPSLVDAARQQSELVVWLAQTLQEHDNRIDAILRHLPAPLRANIRAEVANVRNAPDSARRLSPFEEADDVSAHGPSPEGSLADGPSAMGSEDADGSAEHIPHYSGETAGDARDSLQELVSAAHGHGVSSAASSVGGRSMGANERRSSLGTSLSRPLSAKSSALSRPLSAKSSGLFQHVAERAEETMASKFQALEEALADLAERRLEVPSLRNDVDSLQKTVDTLVVAVENMESRGPPSESVALQQGSGRDSSPGSPSGNRRDARRTSSATRHDRQNTAPFFDGEEPGRTPNLGTAHGRMSGLGALGALPVIGKSSFSDAVSSAARGVYAADVKQLELFESRIDRFEASTSDTHALLLVFQEKLQVLDSDYRAHAKSANTRIDLLTVAEAARKDEDVRQNKTWNLAGQVDVIQSIIGESIRHLKADLLSELGWHSGHQESAGLGVKGRGLLNPTKEQKAAPDIDLKLLDDKIRRLQECCQQVTLKVAAVQSVTKRTDQTATIAAERFTRLSNDFDNLAQQVTRHEIRIEYLAVRPPSGAADKLSSSGEKRGNSGRPISPKPPRQLTWSQSPGHDQLGTGKRIMGRRAPTDLDGSGEGSSKLSLAPEVTDDRHEFGRQLSDSSRLHGDHEVHHPDPTRQVSEDPAPSATGSDFAHDVNTVRIVRLGKKLSALDQDVSTRFQNAFDDIDIFEKRLCMIISFLPKRHRMMVQRLAPGKHPVPNQHDEEEAAATSENASADGNVSAGEGGDARKKVSFSRRRPEIRMIKDREELAEVPWQLVGEHDQKWEWCFRHPNQMGRDLARHLAGQENEWLEFRKEVMQMIENLCGNLTTRSMSKSYATSPESEVGNISSKASMLQLAGVEERLDGLAADLREVRRLREKDYGERMEKDRQLQTVVSRLALFDNFDSQMIVGKVDHFEGRIEYFGQLVKHISEQVRTVEVNCALRADLSNLEQELAHTNDNAGNLHNELKELSSSFFGSNRQLTSSITEVKGGIEKQMKRLDGQKVNMAEFTVLFERISKLEAFLRDSRTIMASDSGQEMSAFVRRIILNIEDKIMMLEKKIDLLSSGRVCEQEPVKIELQGDTGAATGSLPAKMPVTSTLDGKMKALGQELVTISQAVHQLRQEVNLSKVDMDHVAEQGQHHAELVQRLSVYVDAAAAGSDGDCDGPVALSYQRLQVMVGAAARHLVAGSKWLTREAFDMRVSEIRKEYTSSFRQLQAQIEEVNALVFKTQSQTPDVSSNLVPRLPRMSRREQKEAGGSADAVEWSVVAAEEEDVPKLVGERQFAESQSMSRSGRQLAVSQSGNAQQQQTQQQQGSQRAASSRANSFWDPQPWPRTRSRAGHSRSLSSAR